MNVVIVRSRRKTLSLSVNGRAEIVVRAPLRLSEGEIFRFIRRHEKWIQRRLSEFERVKLNLDDGEKISLFGKELTISSGRSALKDGKLLLPETSRTNALATFLKRYAKDEMSAKTKRLAKEFGFSYASVRISSARARWGSCNRKGGIAFSFRVAFLPDEIAEYVVVHELCHTRYFNHSPQFWQEVEKVLPDYKLRRKTLKTYGNFMNLL